jgi:hypothetical protein
MQEVVGGHAVIRILIGIAAILDREHLDMAG